MKYIYLFICLMLINTVSATDIDIVYINDSITAQVYYNNGSTQYHYNETNVLSDNFNTVMVTGTTEDSIDLLENPTSIYDNLLFILMILFFAFMFIFLVWIIKKVIG